MWLRSMFLKDNSLFRRLQYLLFLPIFLISISGEANAQKMRVIAGKSATDPSCIALIYPVASTEGEPDTIIRIISQTGQDLVIAPVKRGDVTRIDLVYGDRRLAFAGQRIMSQAQMETSGLWRIMNGAQKFHLTAWLRDGRVKSSKFEGVSGEQILALMQQKCGVELPSEASEEFVDSADLSLTDLRMAIWAARRVEGTEVDISQVPAHLSRDDRDGIKRFQRTSGFEPTGNLDQQTLSGLLQAAGVAIAPRFADAMDFSAKTSAVAEKDTWGSIDRDGNWLVDPIYQSAFPANSSAIPFEQGGRWVAIDGTGKRVPRFVADDISGCAEDWCIVRTAGGLKLVSLTGLNPPNLIFDEISPFSNGVAFGRIAADWMRISKNGAVTPWRSGIHRVKNHWAKHVAVQQASGGKWQISTLDGQILGEKVDKVWPPRNGLAAFEQN